MNEYHTVSKTLRRVFNRGNSEKEIYHMNHQLFFIFVIEMVKKLLVALFMMMFMCSVAVDFGATVTISDCGSNTTILHFTDYHATEVKRNKVLSFWSGDALLKENITAGKATLLAYRNDVGYWLFL